MNAIGTQLRDLMNGTDPMAIDGGIKLGAVAESARSPVSKHLVDGSV